MDDPITWESLATVTVASGAAASLVAFIRVFTSVSPAAARMLAAVFGVLIVELAILALGASGWREIVLGLFTGIAAGLAASKSVEIAATGWGHEITAMRSEQRPVPAQRGAQEAGEGGEVADRDGD